MSRAPHAVLVGAGGLGGPIAYALAHAGHRLTLVDHDVVELSNLQRQIQFRTADIGRPKVAALAAELARRGCPPDRVRPLPVRFDADTAPALLDGADLIIDGSDDFATKFAVNDHAMAAGLPFVIASVLRYGGQVLAHDPARADHAAAGCYRCLFEDPPGADEAGPTCADAGVLGAAVAVIGGHAARAALALQRGRRDQDMLAGGLWVFDDVRALERVRQVRFASRSTCPACGLRAAAPRAVSLSSNP